LQLFQKHGIFKISLSSRKSSLSSTFYFLLFFVICQNKSGFFETDLRTLEMNKTIPEGIYLFNKAQFVLKYI
tara:strand:+ start:314 stop:529 length:216 start_codon:yes stop_codon:yes gene_type:complete